MVGRRRPWGAAAAAASIAFALTVTAAPTAAFATNPPSVPTPQDIANAKRNETAKQAEITKISGLLAQYQQLADDAQRDAQTKAEQLVIATQNLADATRTASSLAAQQKAAQKKAAASQRQAAAIIAQLARTGGGDVTLGLISGSGAQTDQLLQRLGAMNRLSATSQAILEKAQYDRNAASSLAKQASVAKAKRASLADDAQDAADASQTAADAANAKVASVESSQSTLYSQLADLKGTTAALEQQAAEAAALASAQQTSQPSSGGSSGSTGSSGSGSSGSSGSSTPPKGVDPTPPAPSASAVAIAIAFAEQQLGKPYSTTNGLGPNSWDCSGLTKKSYAAAGVYIGEWGSNAEYTYLRGIGRLVDRRTAGIAAGDLLFYSDGGDPNIPNYHVTMAIGGGQMIEAPYPGLGVRIVAIRTTDLVPYVGRPTG